MAIRRRRLSERAGADDLSADQFNRVMLAMAAWVAPPDQSCNYCHDTENMADDSLYTKKVARA